MRRASQLLIICMIVVFAGCAAANRAIDTAVNRAGTVVGESVGSRVGAMVSARFPNTWTQQWMTLYVNYLFSVAFHSGSYTVVDEAYEPGEYTRWRFVDENEESPAVIERALLSRTDEGNEWWKVKYINTEEDEDLILEGLFDIESGELLRLRAQFPGEEPEELPVEEGTYGYVQPIQLTEASLEGATVGTETVRVPAGTFTARHIRYGSAGSTLEWWLNDDVPGGMVRYLARSGNTDADEEAVPESWTVELASFGSDARSELGVQ